MTGRYGSDSDSDVDAVEEDLLGEVEDVGPGWAARVRHVPFTADTADVAARGGVSSRAARQEDPFRADPDEQDAVGGPRLRPPPAGMQRRDRREWRMLEAARLHRLLAADRRADPDGSWRGGFLQPAPGWMNRKARKAWLAAERQEARQWWQHRRTAGGDARERATGALLLAAVIAVVVAALAAGLLISRLSGHVSSSSTSSLEPTGAFVPSVTSSRSAWSDARTGTRMSRPGPAGEPGRAAGTALLGSGWEPTPAGGVIAVKPSTGRGLRVDAAAVRPAPIPTTAPTDRDLSTPTGAVRAWLARTCAADWRRPFGASVTLARPAMTGREWTVEDPARDREGRAWWEAQVVPGRQLLMCGGFTAALSDGHQASSTFARVVFTADKVLTEPGRSARVWRTAGVRQVVLSDGRWLVDAAVVGG
ncbi:hypothetical protein [Nakamurella endophytica]|uniref:Uncharacterized protein n=1 Tax=Nakamurella endophytica TaxID=1748367 RepID=A0A917WM83_9ACTN|nr:hypothetical protein [Nakamurella endophytica]GGM15880.1 hypothetical protein GCM10011594_39910 [Nakamurella endophytica]